LHSPEYGEKWGGHWLDLVRYAESDGFKLDEIPTYSLALPGLRIRSLTRTSLQPVSDGAKSRRTNFGR